MKTTVTKRMPERLSRDYRNAWIQYVSDKKIIAALYEGADSAGGYAVPVTVDGQILPLAGEDSALRRVARVITTDGDIKIPLEVSETAADTKAESGASDFAFDLSGPTLSQTLLTAYQIGDETDLSWELASDAPELIPEFLNPSIERGVRFKEETAFVTGSGSGEPQGILSSGGAPFGVAHSVVSLDPILDLIGSIKAEYLDNASFLMNRKTAVAARKQQIADGQYVKAWTREIGSQGRPQDFLFGFPVYYSAGMPTIAQSAKVICFGDFRRAVVIGDRGGSAISIKVLDQTKATIGLVTVLGYRRTDQRIVAPEAISTFVIDSGS